ncbi:MAG: hypothetical protein BMS9Abin29_0732 [Gemmatimonadota bacterium]|nr:MAG: hypothetical protein BMS9Abin29_0732 [Gemmatimonadota bacterium]
MSLSLNFVASVSFGLAVLQACTLADEPGEAPGLDLEAAITAPTLADRLLGAWNGGNATRGRMSFVFAADQTVVWVIYPPSGPDTLRINYRATEVDGRLEIDLSGFDRGPLAGLDMYGLAIFDGNDSLRIDFEPGPPGGPGSRPADLSSTDVLTLVRSGSP